ncbi:ATP-binding cassette domain-containing protein [Shewanella mesophila]|uniref:ATP-binding cassette domain-containing protein n=1 Tax=Shewanella mesophila TaxID=2864208 RepID=UPI001C65861B|nr:ATP-binding cassette domain-containing protein [Shewanella mesophila]QYJ86651.1 ATP-binding cassette domain-containing protein [Shewanella mesophila]
MLLLHKGCVRRGDQVIRFPDIQLKRGEIVGISGPSGIGKSTLASMLAGMIPVQADQRSLPTTERGKPNPVQWLIQQGEFAFNPRLTLKTALDESWQCDDYLPLLKDYGLEPSWLARRPNQLSGGQLQRFNLIRALVPTTQFLICDEVTAHLDTITQAEFWQHLLATANMRNLGVLVISHDPYLLEVICDRIIIW